MSSPAAFATRLAVPQQSGCWPTAAPPPAGPSTWRRPPRAFTVVLRSAARRPCRRGTGARKLGLGELGDEHRVEAHQGDRRSPPAASRRSSCWRWSLALLGSSCTQDRVLAPGRVGALLGDLGLPLLGGVGPSAVGVDVPRQGRRAPGRSSRCCRRRRAPGPTVALAARTAATALHLRMVAPSLAGVATRPRRISRCNQQGAGDRGPEPEVATPACNRCTPPT